MHHISKAFYGVGQVVVSSRRPPDPHFPTPLSAGLFAYNRSSYPYPQWQNERELRLFIAMPRRVVLRNWASRMRDSRKSVDEAARSGARFAYTSFVSTGRKGAQREWMNGTTSF